MESRTTLLLVRFRYHIITIEEEREFPLLAEECQLLGFSGPPADARWLDGKDAEKLLVYEPSANITPDQATYFIKKIIEGFDLLRPIIDKAAHERAAALLEAHRRVRAAARLRNLRYRVEPHLPPDVLGIYIYLPATSKESEE